MKSAQNRTIQATTKIEWKKEWKTGIENARRLHNMSQHPNTTAELKLYEKLKRKQVVMLSRLRTEHCHLNQYLHQFNIIETPECECGGEKETVEHYLLNCELYDEKKHTLRRKVEAQGMRPSILLEDSQTIQDIMNYIEKTDRFKLEQR
jgi:hypothetical protein